MQKSDIYFLLKRRRNQKLRARSKTRGFASYFVKGLLAAVLVAITGLLIWGTWEYSRITANLPSTGELALLLDRTHGELLTPTRIVDRTGSVVLAELGNPGIPQQFLSIDPAAAPHFSPNLLDVVIQVIQPDFWQSSGVDFPTLTNPDARTIAERLVLGILLPGEPASPLRGLRMRLLAAQVVHDYGRAQLLEWYLNSVYLGHDVYGVDAASRLYLGKSAQELSLAQSALIAGLMDAPALNPLDSPAASIDLQRGILAWLQQNGKLDSAAVALALQEKLEFQAASASARSSNSGLADHVIDQLGPVLGIDRLKRGGLTIITTIDAELQAQLNCTAITQLERIENSSTGQASNENDCPASTLLPTQNFSTSSYSGLAARGIVADPKTGEVLAYLAPTLRSGESLSDGDTEAGSLLSPVVALAGFARGESPASLMWDIPSSLPANLSGSANPDGASHGPVSLRSAIANDYVVPIAQLAQQISPAVTWQMASSLGLDSYLTSPDSAEPLFRGSDVPLLELAQVYATLANAGTRTGVENVASGQIDLNLVMRVETASHRVLIDNSNPQKLAVVSESLAYLINNVLSDAAARYPSLGNPNALEIDRPAAAKIGQTQSGNRVWTAGYTPQRVVIIGVQTAVEPASAALQPVMAAGLWNAMMQYSSASLPAEDWARPPDISEMQVCYPSGLLPTAACPEVVREVFLSGNEPTYPDNLYQKVKINRETGLLATVFTPSDLVDEKLTMDVPAAAREWALAAGLPLTPGGYDAIQAVSQDPQVKISSPLLFAPVHGKVEIRGTANNSAFKSYSIQVGEGINPSEWIQIGESGSTPVTDGVLATWDTQGSNGLYAVRLSVIDQSNQVKTAIIQVTVDNVAPQVTILYPQPDAVVTPVNGMVTFNAEAEDDIAVARVEWWLDGKKVNESTAAPFYFIWQATPGKHKLSLMVWDTAGNQSTSAELNYTVAK